MLGWGFSNTMETFPVIYEVHDEYLWPHEEWKWNHIGGKVLFRGEEFYLHICCCKIWRNQGDPQWQWVQYYLQKMFGVPFVCPKYAHSEVWQIAYERLQKNSSLATQAADLAERELRSYKADRVWRHFNADFDLYETRPHWFDKRKCDGCGSWGILALQGEYKGLKVYVCQQRGEAVEYCAVRAAERLKSFHERERRWLDESRTKIKMVRRWLKDQQRPQKA